MKTHTLLAVETIAAAVLLICCINPAHAGDADVCYQVSPPRIGGMPPVQAHRLTSQTVFDCPRAGKHTLPQLAQEGWSIVAVQPVAIAGGIDWMVVIERTSEPAK